MVATVHTRKPITAIEAEDFDAFPIWEFCADEEHIAGMDESWIRPARASTIAKGVYALTVAANLTLSNGSEWTGFVGVNTADGFEVSGLGFPFPRYCFIPAESSDADRAAFAACVGAPSERVFPVFYRLRVHLEGETSIHEGQFG